MKEDKVDCGCRVCKRESKHLILSGAKREGFPNVEYDNKFRGVSVTK